VTITNVPDSSSFTLPEGVAGSAEKQVDGSWVIKGIGSHLDTLIFHPGDANKNNWNGKLSIDIHAVDNGVVGTTVNKIIDVDVTPNNDVPVNHLPSDKLTVDEDKPLLIKGLSISDVDSHDDNAKMNMTVTLKVKDGHVSFADNVDTHGLNISYDKDHNMVINGNVNTINKALAEGVTYLGNPNFNGVDALTMVTDDKGNSGNVIVFTESSTINNEVGISIPENIKIPESIQKEYHQNGDISVIVKVDHGELFFDKEEMKGVVISRNDTASIKIIGSIDAVNNVIEKHVHYKNTDSQDKSSQISVEASYKSLTDSSSIAITVNAVNDAPVNEVPTTITASEDTATVVDGLTVTDVDFNELANNEGMSVTLSVNHGSLSITLPINSGVEVTDDGSGNVVLKGSMADINTVLDSGVSYTATENFSGSDELTIMTTDGGNTGTGGSLSTTNKVNITVTPKADAPSLSLSTDHLQTAAIQSSLGTMLPLIGLIVAASADASETLTIKISDLGSASIVDKAGNVIGIDLGNGEWQITAQDLSDVYIKDLDQGSHTIRVEAVSTESDGSQAISPPVNINVVVDDLSATNNVIGQNSASDQANLVIDSTAQATLLGGDGNDILVGGLASDILVGGRGDDILWGGDLDGNGDGVKDTFLWSDSDFGTANAPATDTIMDFEVGIDTINLGDALDSQKIQSLDYLNNHLNIVEQQGNTEIQIFDDQHQVVQNIILNGVSYNDLFGDNSLNMSNEDKLGSLLNNGNLKLSDNFGNQQENTLVADNQGESLFGFDGNDILVAGQGNDILTGGNGNDMFTWHETSLSTKTDTITDTITDFELGKDKIDIRELLANDDKSDIDDLLKHVSADVDSKGNVNLTVDSDNGHTQNIDININPHHELGLADGVSSADIVSSLFNHNAFQVDNNH
ncbi:hcalcium-binding protein, partial [Photobacterium carnosum]